MGFFQRFFLAAIIACSGVFAASADSVMALSKKWFDSGKGWEFNFKLRIDYAGVPETGYQAGKVLVADKDRFRLQMSGLSIYCDGKNFWQWNKDQNQVLLKLLEDMESEMHPSELLFKYLSCKPLSMKTETVGKEKAYVITLDASKYGKNFSGMEVFLREKDASPVRLVTTDPVGNVSTYEISNLKRRDKLEPAEFVLKPEAGVDLIDMR